MKAALDICLLALLNEGDSYGLELREILEQAGFDTVSKNSIYPILRRMQKEDLIESYLKASEEGPARRYYRITEGGKHQLGVWGTEFLRFSRTVEKILTRGSAIGT